MLYTAQHVRDYGKLFDAKFPTKVAKGARIKAALNDCELNTALEGRDLNAALAILAGHPQVEAKVGTGIVGIEVRAAKPAGRCFHLVRADGTTTDFSYLKCLTPPAPRQNVQAAARNAIRADMAGRKIGRLNTDPTCQLTGMPIDASNSHVHHAPPMFDVLTDDWAATQGGYEEIAGRLLHGDNVYGQEFCEIDKTSWLTWHTNNAVLQVVHATANLSIEAARRAIKAS